MPQPFAGKVGNVKSGQLTAFISKDVPFEDQTLSPTVSSLGIVRTFLDFLFGKFPQNQFRSQNCYDLA